ncbi:MAG: transporter substrate-binding domain-containing protein [Actinomycetota bacterium]|nr:transporter substrate-binding domain-containing protein [Actinomycetota bacterium]
MRLPNLRFACIVTALALGGVACAKSATPAATGTTGASASVPKTITPGFISVGSCLDYAPFESVKNGEPVGFDVEMTDAVAAKLGFDKAHVKWVKANFNTIFTAVANGQFDMVAAAVTATGATGAKRAQTVSFSNFYYNSRQSLSVNSAQSPDITSTDQLKAGDTVGGQKGSTGLQWAIDNLQSKGITIKTYTSATDSFRDLSAGNITGVINDESSSYAIAASMNDVKVVEPIDTNEKYAFAFAPTAPDLVTAWNAGLKQVIDDGEYAQIYAKYFPGTPVPAEYTPGGSSTPSA